MSINKNVERNEIRRKIRGVFITFPLCQLLVILDYQTWNQIKA